MSKRSEQTDVRLIPPPRTIPHNKNPSLIVNEQICVRCDREITADEYPWKFYGDSSEDFTDLSSEPALVCEECYQELDSVS